MSGSLPDIQPAEGATPVRHRWRRRVAMGSVAALAVAAGGAWLARERIADRFIRDELARRGVQASYDIAAIGVQRERLKNVVIGDPGNPDLTVADLEVVLGFGPAGPFVEAVRASGVRLNARYANGKLDLGELAKFIPPPADEPASLPDIGITLSNASARIATPWGLVGVGLAGQGNAQRNFRGHYGVAAPALLAGECRVAAATSRGSVKVRSGVVNLLGLVGAGSGRCGDGLAGPISAALATSFNADFTRADARLTGTGGALRHPAATAAGLQFAMDGDLRAGRATARFGVTGRGVAGEPGRADTLVVRGEVAASDGRFAGDAVLTANRARADPAMIAQMRGAGAAAQGTPLAAFAAAAATALAAAMADAEGSARLTLSGRADRFALAVHGAALTAASGLELRDTSFAAAPLLRWTGGPDGRSRLRIAGALTARGGGLPDASISFAPNGGGWAGRAVLAPWAIGRDLLALDPVAYRITADGSARLASALRLSGPLADGRVEGLRLPLDVQRSAGGTVAVAGGCRPVAADALTLAGVTLDAPAITLCSAPGQPLLSAGPSGLAGRVAARDIALNGLIGDTALAVRAGTAALDLATYRWSLADVALWLGAQPGQSLAPRRVAAAIDAAPTPPPPPAPVPAIDPAAAPPLALAEPVSSALPELLTDIAVTRLDIAALSGAAADGGWRGQVSGLTGTLAAVPLLMDEVAGDWRWAEGALTLDGGLRVRDAQRLARFQPMGSDNLALRYADGKLVARADLAERTTGTRIAAVTVNHLLDGARGSAAFTVKELSFGERFQPDQLSRLALGVIANATATVDGSGQIDWSGGTITSRGSFQTRGADFAAAFGPVSGAATTISFDDLLALRSAPGQQITLAEINPGIAVRGGVIGYQMLDATRVRIEGGRWPFAGGVLELAPTTLDFAENAVRRLEFRLIGVDAAVFLQEMDFANITATGVFDGAFPVEFSGLGADIVGGKLVSRGGGTLSYVGELSNQNLGVIANFAFNTLKSVQYRTMVIDLDGALDGEMVTDIRFDGLGQGPNASRNLITRQVAKLPLVLNLKITGPFRQLIGSAQGLYDPDLLVGRNRDALNDLVRARTATQPTPVPQPSVPPPSAPPPPIPPAPDGVQPAESEPMP